MNCKQPSTTADLLIGDEDEPEADSRPLLQTANQELRTENSEPEGGLTSAATANHCKQPSTTVNNRQPYWRSLVIAEGRFLDWMRLT